MTGNSDDVPAGGGPGGNGPAGEAPSTDFSILAPGAMAAFRSERVAMLYRHWQGLCGARDMPRRADLDPAAIRGLLPYLMLVDLLGEPPRARYRLVGTAVVEMAKLDFTGQFADEIDFKEVEDFDYAAAYRRVASARRPGLGHSVMLVAGLKARWIEFLICPLSDDGSVVNLCVALEDYEPIDLIELDSLPRAVRR